MQKSTLYRIGAAVAVLVLVLLLLQLVLSPANAGRYLQSYIRENYGWNIAFQDFDYDLYPLRLRAGALVIYGGPEHKDVFLQTKAIQVEIPYRSLWSDDFRITRLNVTSPTINFENAPRVPAATADTSGGFFIDHVEISSGSVRYSNLEITEILLKGSVDEDGAELTTVKARFHQSQLTADGVVYDWSKPQYRFDYRIQGNAADVALIFPEIPAVQGSVDMYGILQGNETMFVVEGEGETPALRISDSPPFTAKAKYRFDSSDETSPLSLVADWENISLASLQPLLPSVPMISSLSGGTIEYDGGTDIWLGEGLIHLHLEPLPEGKLRPSALLNGHLKDGIFQLEIENLTLGRTAAHVAGTLEREKLDIYLKAEIGTFADLRAIDESLAGVPGSYLGDIRIHGTYENPVVEGTVAGRDSNFDILGKGSFLPATAQMNIELDGRLNAAFIDPRLSGRLDVHGKATGTVSRPILEASVQGSEFKFEDYTIGDWIARIESDGSTLVADAGIPDLSVSAHLTHSLTARTFQLEASVQDLSLDPLRAFLPKGTEEWSGSITASLSAFGHPNHLKNTTATLTFDESVFQKGEISIRVSQGGSIRLENNQLQADLEAILPQGQLHASGTLPLDFTRPMDLSVSGSGDLSFLQSEDYTIQGKLELDARIEGTVSAPAYSGKAILQDGSLLWPSRSMNLTQMSGEINLAKDHIRAKAGGLLNDAPILLEGTLPLVSDREGKILAELKSIDLKTLLPEQDLEGKISVTARAFGKGTSTADWNLEARLEPSELVIAGNALSLEPLQIQTDQRTVTLLPFRASVPSLMNLSGQGKLNLDTMEMEAGMELDSEIEMLGPWIPDLEGTGSIRVDLDLKGPVREPKAEGKVEVDNAYLRIPGYPFVIEQLHLQAPFLEDRIRIDAMSARMGGGSIQGKGEIGWRGESAGKADIQISARNVGTNYPQGFRGLWNADLTLSGTKEYTLAGNILLLRSAYREDINPESRLLQTLLDQKRALLPEKEQTTGRFRLDLTIQTEQDVLVDNNLARLKAGAMLAATGTIYQPRLSGRMEMRQDSELLFQGKTYAVEVATIDFLGRRTLNPDLNVAMLTDLTYDDQACEARLTLTGSMEDPDVQITTNCQAIGEIGEYEIYSLLLTGTADPLQNPKELFARQFSSFLAGTLLFDVQQRIAKSLGLERLQIEPLNIATEGNPGARFTLTKRVPPLQLTYSLALSESTDQTWIADYRIGNFNVSFVDPEEDRYTGSVRHRFRFGRGGIPRSAFVLRDKTRRAVIESLTLSTEEPSIPEARIREILDSEPGTEYDYWGFQNRVVRLQETLQDAGYLFPDLQIREEEPSPGEYALTIRVPRQQAREMIFTGWKIDKKQSTRYRLWWQEAFTPITVPRQIQDDLLHTLQSKGYYQAEVRYSSEEANGRILERFDVTPGTQFKKQTIRFTGTQALTAEQLKKRLIAFYASEKEMAAEALNAFRQFQEKVSAVYIESGYMEAAISRRSTEFLPEKGMVAVEIQVHEGPQTMIAELLVAGTDSFPAELLNQLHLKEGGVYRPLLLPDDELTVENYYRSIGHWNARAEVTVVAGGPSDLSLRYEIRSSGIARIAAIRISGNRTTRTGLIERRLGLKTGGVLVQEELSRAQNRLFRMGVFDQVVVEARQTESANEYDIDVRLVERKNYQLAYGIRYDTQKDLEGEVELSDTNLFGVANILSGYTRVNSNERIYQIRYGSPSLFGWDWNAFFLAERKRELDPFFLTHTFSFQQQYHLPSQFDLLAGYQYRKTETRLFDPILGEELVFTLTLPRLTASVFRESRDNPVNAKQGMFLSSSLEYAASFLGSDLPFFKNYNQAYTYVPFSRFTWASGLRLGLAFTEGGQRLIGSERFFAGGSDTLRGFKFRSVGPMNVFTGLPEGGEAVLIVNQELRVPLYRWIHGVVFYDGGNVYLKPEDISLNDFRHSAGFGLRLELPYGIVTRFDLGFNLDPRDNEEKSVFHFSLGQAF